MIPSPEIRFGESVTYAGHGIPLSEYRTDIRTGESLKKFALPVAKWKKRDCWKQLNDFLRDKNTEKVLILYGLRRTGKTTLIRQTVASMKEEELSAAAFIQIRTGNTLADVNHDLKELEKQGIRYPVLSSIEVHPLYRNK